MKLLVKVKYTYVSSKKIVIEIPNDIDLNNPSTIKEIVKHKVHINPDLLHNTPNYDDKVIVGDIEYYDTIIKTNSIQCKSCKDIIVSKNRHSYVSCSCGKCAVDGGKDYLRRAGDADNYIELSVFE